MGLIDISNNEDENHGKTYLSYIMCDEILKLQILKLTETPVHYFLKLSKESTVLKKWAQNLQQSPEKYLDQFYASLQAKPLEDGDSADVFQSKNIFELNEDNLIWRQYFCDKKMFGRKGKFTLEKDENRIAFEQIMDDLVKDIKFKDKTISDLEKQNRSLISENEELQLITEKSVKMKEDLEKNLYSKFATLLNAKKTKLSQYRKKLYEMQANSDAGTIHSQSRQSVENKEFIPKISADLGQKPTTAYRSDDDYDDDTDVDSPEEIDNHDRLNINLKRKDFLSSSGSELRPCIKKAKSPMLPLDESQDLLNASLEMDLGSGSVKNDFRKFKNM